MIKEEKRREEERREQKRRGQLRVSCVFYPSIFNL